MELVHLEPTEVVDTFNDTTHLSQAIFDIKTAFGGYFISDLYSARIYRTDSLLGLVEIIGRKGQGPGELAGPLALGFSASNMYVVDGKVLEVYENNTGHWVHQVGSRLDSLRGGLNECNSFIVHDSSVYFASPMKYWVTKYNLAGMERLFSFGDKFDLTPKGRNTTQLLDFNNTLYVIGVGEAGVYRYDYNGKLMSYKDFRKDHLFFGNHPRSARPV